MTDMMMTNAVAHYFLLAVAVGIALYLGYPNLAICIAIGGSSFILLRSSLRRREPFMYPEPPRSCPDAKISLSTVNRAVCFSEIPLSAMHHFARPPVDQAARYHFYGIALSKKAVFEAGGRPVIYLPDKEGEWIPSDERWRHVKFEHREVDWTHEREWRLAGDLDLTKMSGLYLIVWYAREATEIAAIDTPLRKRIRGILPMEHLVGML
jgi:hypothetical protein